MNGKKLNDGDPANPCGLVAKSYFTDSFVFTSGESTTVTPVNNITINDTNIAWESDREYKFKRLDSPGKNWQDW